MVLGYERYTVDPVSRLFVGRLKRTHILPSRDPDVDGVFLPLTL